MVANLPPRGEHELLHLRKRAVWFGPMHRGQQITDDPAPGRGIMLRGRYGIKWMIFAWLAIVGLLAAGIYLVGNAARVFGG